MRRHACVGLERERKTESCVHTYFSRVSFHSFETESVSRQVRGSYKRGNFHACTLHNIKMKSGQRKSIIIGKKSMLQRAFRFAFDVLIFPGRRAGLAGLTCWIVNQWFINVNAWGKKGIMVESSKFEKLTAHWVGMLTRLQVVFLFLVFFFCCPVFLGCFLLC